MPERFLLQVLRSLVNHGILRSTRGVDGGYALTRPIERISMLDLIEAIEGPVVADQTAGDVLPDGARQKLGAALRRVTVESRRQLEAIKLSQLLPPPK